MASYHIYSKTSGEDLGVYHGDSAHEAIDALHADAGYSSTASMCAALGLDIAKAYDEYHVEIVER